MSRLPLTDVFAQIRDPRDPRGVRHGLATILSIAQAAVTAGARTLTAIHEWVTDVDREALARLGINPSGVLPCESTIRRALASIDADALDAKVGMWMATRVGRLAGRSVIAIDGKSMRGASTATGPMPHLLAALHHGAGVVTGQLAVAAKSNEIPALPVLLAQFDLAEVLVTADALHCQRESASYITGRGGHYLLTVKGNQPSLRAKLKALPWKDVPATTAVSTGHGRRVRCSIKTVSVPAWVEFPGAAQIAQVRRTRIIKGRKHVEVVYLICSLDMTAAPPASVAAWIQGHWGIEVRHEALCFRMGVRDPHRLAVAATG